MVAMAVMVDMVVMVGWKKNLNFIECESIIDDFYSFYRWIWRLWWILWLTGENVMLWYLFRQQNWFVKIFDWINDKLNYFKTNTFCSYLPLKSIYISVQCNKQTNWIKINILVASVYQCDDEWTAQKTRMERANIHVFKTYSANIHFFAVWFILINRGHNENQFHRFIYVHNTIIRRFIHLV